jgi:hypothetical protein
LFQSLRHPDVIEVNVFVRDFLQERWKGNLPILSAQQLRQARLNELIYVDVLNASNLPGDQRSNLAADKYAFPETSDIVPPSPFISPLVPSKSLPTSHPQDVIVIGAGFSGLITAWQTSLRGCKTTVISRGWGTPYWTSGCIDILGHLPPVHNDLVASPQAALDTLERSSPNHPYPLAGMSTLEHALSSFQALCEASNYPFYGSLEKNILLPTSLGTLRPTCLVPATMLAGDASRREPMIIVGFDRFYDFYPMLIASNLEIQGRLASDISLDLPSLRSRNS